MKNILVFPCGSEIGLEIHQSLHLSSHFNLFGASSVDDHGSYTFANYIGQLPMISDSDFLDKFQKLIIDLNIDFIFPAHDDAVLKLSEYASKNLLGNSQIISSNYASCQITRSKKSTYQHFQNILPTPQIFSLSGIADGKTFFLKPDIGQGSKGTYKVNSVDEAKFYLKKDPSLLILEYLPGKEYTIDCFTDKFGKLRFSQGRERLRVSNGISVRANLVRNPKFEQLAEKINNHLKLRGAWFFQVKESSKKELSLLEIAPRIAGTMGYSRNKGVNLPLLSLFDKMGFDVEICENNYALELDRSLASSFKHNINYKSVYIDFDDTILVKNQINTRLISFIFQCLNKKIKVYLITKHLFNIQDTLEKYRLNQVFDKVIHLTKSEKKFQHIDVSQFPIFIDDSFSERFEVKTKLGIPVFDISEIEPLMAK
jgi:hypothetical protein